MSRFAAIFEAHRKEEDERHKQAVEAFRFHGPPHQPTFRFVSETGIDICPPPNRFKNESEKLWEQIQKREPVPSAQGKMHLRDVCFFCYGKAHKAASSRNFTLEPSSIGPWRGHKAQNQAGAVTCPVLFQLRCFVCGATGEQAHTHSHCPNFRNTNNSS